VLWLEAMGLLLSVACSGRPDAEGPIIDETGVVDGWTPIRVDPSLPLRADEVLLRLSAPDVLQVAWSRLACQDNPILRLSPANGEVVELHIWRGELPSGGCEAMGVIDAYEVRLTEPMTLDDFELVDHGD
jgi:hypothetical protein